MNVYCFLEDLKSADLNTTSDKDDQILVQYCLMASRDWERLCYGRLFYPRYETRYYDNPRNTHRLRVDDDLLEISAITTANGSETLTASNYWGKSGPSYTTTPFNQIVVDPQSTDFFYWTDTPLRATSVSGYWGFHQDWSNAWIDTLATVDTDSGSTMTVSSVNGIDLFGFGPRFKTRSLIKLSDGTDTEYALVIGVDYDTDTLTLVRGVNGTSQLTATGSIYRFQPEYDVVRSVQRLAAWYYRMKDTSRPDLDRPIFTDEGIILPPRFPMDVQEAAKQYRVKSIGIL